MSHDGVPLPVTHYQFLGWPDHGVPKFATSLIEFNRRVKHEYSPGTPILVHCSAGVGRTGTYITLDAMLERMKERMKEDDTICVYEFVRNMRAKRVFMVQTQVPCHLDTHVCIRGGGVAGVNEGVEHGGSKGTYSN